MSDNQLIKILYPYVPTNELAEYMNISVKQLYQRTFSLGVKKNPIIKYKMNKGLILTAGRNSRFQKGHQPFNKGKKMNVEVYSKVQKTMFKKGNKPANTKEPNATSIRTDKGGRMYYYSKIKDGMWVLTHRLMWEQAHGPIPAKHIVRFIDGDTMNLQLSNLECIPMSENANRNTIHRFPDDLKKVIRLKAKLNKHIKNKING